MLLVKRCSGVGTIADPKRTRTTTGGHCQYNSEKTRYTNIPVGTPNLRKHSKKVCHYVGQSCNVNDHTWVPMTGGDPIILDDSFNDLGKVPLPIIPCHSLYVGNVSTKCSFRNGRVSKANHDKLGDVGAVRCGLVCTVVPLLPNKVEVVICRQPLGLYSWSTKIVEHASHMPFWYIWGTSILACKPFPLPYKFFHRVFFGPF
ncbi:uncharacterized protein MELLADRAFT_103649 [Melampsora larici-populina 98AG31]|uniref:Uncharacterized protein n=1 Tax=Melampsora larici-populina (strain 98AG31 / pathotype 3-4-7) TaxID=747676 RepID=F4RC09_MELLP|nr:uncharacterized protein MELLADRAFT_103649 [Melampsora larici-populina 98AG31]EGG10195.1 hypothetical protein MELLADRAFT_103649 [Melampsora larici-populina 98AG31]